MKADLLRQLEMASNELETQLQALRLTASPAIKEALDRGASQLSTLNALRDQLVSGAKGASLDALRASVASAVADIRAYTSDARIAAAAAQGTSPQAEAVALQQASDAARTNVTGFMSDYYDQHIFDRYLTFNSTSDREEYRRREQERHGAIDMAFAEKTAEGDLRASELSIDQLKDAGAHGATRSPLYQPELKRLETGQRELAHQLARQGKVTQQTVSDTSQGTSAVPPELIAQFKAANVALADPAQDGHGVSARSPVGDGRGRS